MTTLAQTGTDGVTVEAPIPPEGWNLLSFTDGGFIMYPVTFCALMVAVLAVRAAWRLKQGEPRSGSLTRATIDGVLFWGGYALVLGFLGTVIGITMAARAVELVGEAHAALVWAGIRVSLISTLYGLLILGVSAVLWFGLRHWHRTAVLGGI